MSKTEVVLTACVLTKDNNRLGIEVDFPTTIQEIHAKLKTDSIADCKVKYVSCKTIPPLIDEVGYVGNDTTLDELQYISSKIADLSADERLILTAYLESGGRGGKKTVNTVVEALENFEALYLDPSIKTMPDITRRWLGTESIRSTIDGLSSSSDPADKNLLGYLWELEIQYAQAWNEQNDSCLTMRGLLSIDWKAFFAREGREVPDEYRLSTKEKPSLLEQLRDATKTANELNKDNPAQNKTGPEL